MYVVFGGAGFIGSNVVGGLNELGITDILVVDNLKRNEKFINLVDCEFTDYLDKKEFRESLESDKFPFSKIYAIFHQGACSDTMETDGQYMMDNNYSYSKLLLNKAIRDKIPFIYASSAAVYGTNTVFKENLNNERPINIYGYSKYLFDQYVRGILGQAHCTIVGLRYFNVYGPHEAHKGCMASVTYQFYKQLRTKQTIKLFEGTDGQGNGEQQRDFVYISDVVKVNLFFLNNSPAKDIFNVGTGNCGSFNQIADCLIQLEVRGEKEYISFPEILCNKYQNFTQADISNL